jgi:hypothetical protein
VVVAALDGGRLAEREDRDRTVGGAGVVHRAVVVAAIHRDRLGGEAASGECVEQTGDGGRLMVAGGLDFPGER